MTTGTSTTGVWDSPPNDKFHYAKSWSGTNGKTITDRATRKPNWNPYVMSMGRMKSSNANKLGYLDSFSGGAYKQVDNHSFETSGGSMPGTIGYRASTGSGTLFPIAFPTSTFNLFWGPSQEYTLLGRLLKKVNGHGLNLGVSLAEVDKLAGTVLSTLKTIAFGAEDLAKGNFARFARRFGTDPPTRDVVRSLKLKDIPGRFLEMQYAWIPTIQDCFEAATAFEALSNGPRQAVFRKTYRIGRDLTYNTNYCRNLPQQVTISKTYLFEMYEEMDAFRQMGLTNPATILWERLPWSFVVDWFMPIGSYLDLIGQVPFMKGRWLETKSMKWNTAGTFGFGLHSTPAAPFVDCDWERFHLTRNPIGNPGVPFPDFSVNGAVHGKRVWNAIALTSQKLIKLAGA